MSSDTRLYAMGTSVSVWYPWGTYVTARVLCSDGRVRKVSRISQTADTFFSVPCAVKVKGRTVSGYLTIDTLSGSSVPTDNDPAVAMFVAYTYGKNGHLLPRGKYSIDDHQECQGMRARHCRICNTGEYPPDS